MKVTNIILLLGSISAIKISQPTIAESKTREDKKNLDDWASGHGNNVPSYNSGDKSYVMLGNVKKEKQVVNNYKELMAQLDKEDAHELAVPHMAAENDKDTAPE